nr:tetratricopeptide repeat protein [Desulfobacula sp.]
MKYGEFYGPFSPISRIGKSARAAPPSPSNWLKNYFLTPERTLSRKFREALITGILEYKFDKDTILEMYLNEIYFGQEGSVSINGIGEASRFFFDKSAADLSVSEAAVLAGLIKAPNQFSPHRNPERCTARRNEVLEAMHKNGWLAPDALGEEKARPVKPAPYRGYHQEAPYFMDYLTGQLTNLYSRETLSSEGLSIFTTIDTQVQAAAEKALRKGLERLEAADPSLKRKDPAQSLQGVVIVMQPKTGYILAMVGGRDYGVSQFNRAVQARRQPGSAFKPFVYLAALDQYTPVSMLDNSPQTFTVNGQPWTPKNYYAQAEPRISFRKALAQSQNLATVNLAYGIGLEQVSRTARAFHFSVPKDPYPSMALGTLELDPLSLARAYCVFPADGVLPFPLSIREVADTEGKTIESRHAEIERLTTPAKAYLMSDLMRDVVRDGTARSLKQLGVTWPVAGKTGTTNDGRDAWFVGYTPDLTALVWVGFDNNDAVKATGATAALPIWADLMKALPQYVSGQWLPLPSGIEELSICADSGKLAGEGCCPRVTEEIFLSENRPDALCPEHECSSPIEKVWNGIKKILPSFKWAAVGMALIFLTGCSILAPKPVPEKPGVSRHPPPKESPAPAPKPVEKPPEPKPLPSKKEKPAAPPVNEQSPMALAAVTFSQQGQAYLKNKKPDEAIRALERAVNLNPRNGENYFYLAEAWIMKGNATQAKEFNHLAEIYMKADPEGLGRVQTQKERINKLK